MAKTETTRTPAIAAEIGGITTGNAWLKLSFEHGQTIELSMGQLTVDICTYATMHGLKQKLVDAAAITRNPETGRSATIEDKYNAVREVYERLVAGQWNKVREGSGTGSGGLLLSALCRLYPAKTAEQLREFLAGKSDEDKAALRASPKIKPIIEQIKAERAKGSDDGADVDAMLGELAD